jgi:hypothetical protein
MDYLYYLCLLVGKGKNYIEMAILNYFFLRKKITFEKNDSVT